MRANFTNFALLPLLLAGCSQSPERSEQVSEPIGNAPDIAPSAALGVAFTYRYAFALDAARLSAAQEAHARACEALSIARCRITGFRYRVDGEDSATGRLEMRLAPDIARRFGQQGVDAVRAVNGKLVDAEATGTDAGAELERLAGEQQAADAAARAAGSRAAATPDAYRRDEQQARQDEAASRAAVARTAAAEQRRALAATPVTFEYESGTGLSAIDTGAPFRSAGATALASARVTLALTLGILALAAPPAIVLALLLLLVRRLRPAWRRWFPAGEAASAG